MGLVIVSLVFFFLLSTALLHLEMKQMRGVLSCARFPGHWTLSCACAEWIHLSIFTAFLFLTKLPSVFI